jgi:apolipoprotein N-acyltransferase
MDLLSAPGLVGAPPSRYGPSHPTQGRRALRVAAALGSALLLWQAFPPAGHALLAPFGVALLVLSCRGTRLRTGAGLGLLHGLAFFLLHITWTGAIAGPVALVALCLLEALFLAGMGAALSASTRLPGWPLWVAAVWTLQEALRSRLPFGGFPWGRLAFSQPDSWATGLAAVGGAPLVTFAVALVGGVVAVLVSRGAEPPVLAAWGVVAVAVVAVGPFVPRPVDGPSVRVALVQGNVPRLGLNAFAQRAAVLGNHAKATHDLAADVRAGRTPRPDLVVWPENASDLDPYTDPQAAATIDSAVRDIGVPVLVGAVLDGPGDKVRNSGIVWDPVSGPGEMYVKQHPVPFGEYMPFRSLLKSVSSKVDLVPRDFAAGDRTGELRVGPATLGDVICFEVAYDGLVRDAVRAGGEVLVVQTNNASFGRSGETDQQLAMGRLRAVEHGRAVLVAATSGRSAVVQPDGRVTARTDVFTRALVVADVPRRTQRTLADRLGLLPELVLSLLGAGAAVAGTALVGAGRR